MSECLHPARRQRLCHSQNKRACRQTSLHTVPPSLSPPLPPPPLPPLAHRYPPPPGPRQQHSLLCPLPPDAAQPGTLNKYNKVNILTFKLAEPERP